MTSPRPGPWQACSASSSRAGVDVVLSPVVDVNSNRQPGDRRALLRARAESWRSTVRPSSRASSPRASPPAPSTTPATAPPWSTRTSSCPGSMTGRWWKRDLAPFAAAVEAGVRCVMTAHVVFSAFGPEPATMNRSLLRHLREDLGSTASSSATHRHERHRARRGSMRGRDPCASGRRGPRLHRQPPASRRCTTLRRVSPRSRELWRSPCGRTAYRSNASRRLRRDGLP